MNNVYESPLSSRYLVAINKETRFFPRGFGRRRKRRRSPRRARFLRMAPVVRDDLIPPCNGVHLLFLLLLF